MEAIDRSSDLPLFFQLKQILLAQIKDGSFLPDSALPSEKRLEKTYGVSQITVRRALRDLADEGYIVRQPGRGTFPVKPKIEQRTSGISGLLDDLAAQGSEMSRKVLHFETEPAPLQVASRLNIDATSPVLCVVKQLFVDEEPLGLSTAYFNLGADIVLTREELSANSAFNVLAEKYGITFPRVVRTFEAVPAREEEADFLDIAPESPLLLVELLTHEHGGRPLSFAKFLLRGDRYKYRHEINKEGFTEAGSLRVESIDSDISG
jgi:GntR family transcriptional regulator